MKMSVYQEAIINKMVYALNMSFKPREKVKEVIIGDFISSLSILEINKHTHKKITRVIEV